jgi:hypothetical protein
MRMDPLHFSFSILTSYLLINLFSFLKKILILFSFYNMNGLDYTLFFQLFFKIERNHSPYVHYNGTSIFESERWKLEFSI